MKAVVKGETHLSNADKRALMEMDLTQFDAVFREGYDKNYFERNITLPYVLFAIGHLVYGATYGRLYFSLDDFRRLAGELEVGYHDKIDMAIYEHYEYQSRLRRVLLFLISPILALLLVGMLVYPLELVISHTVPALLPILSAVAAIVLLFTLGFVWALAFFMLLVTELTEKRDETMANNIQEIAEQEGYETILVSCGGTHRSGIASRLEAAEWETDQIATDSRLGRVLLWLEYVQRGLLNPRRSLRGLRRKLRLR